MDDDLKAYLDAMMAQISGSFERVLARVSSLERALRNLRDTR